MTVVGRPRDAGLSGLCERVGVGVGIGEGPSNPSQAITPDSSVRRQSLWQWSGSWALPSPACPALGPRHFLSRPFCFAVCAGADPIDQFGAACLR